MSSMTSWTSSNSSFIAAPPPTSASKISVVARLHDKMEDVTSGDQGNHGKRRPETETASSANELGGIASKNKTETLGSSSVFPVVERETELPIRDLRHPKRFFDENITITRLSAIDENNDRIQDISNADPVISVTLDTSALPPTAVHHHPDDIRASNHLLLVRRRGLSGSGGAAQLDQHRNIGFSVADILDPAKFNGNNYPERGITGSRRLAGVLGREATVPEHPGSPPAQGALQSAWSPWLERIDLHVRNRLKLNKFIDGYLSEIIFLLCKKTCVLDSMGAIRIHLHPPGDATGV